MKLLQPGTAKLWRESVPKHVGVIMDGNGRWASYRGLDRTEGHRQGWHAALNVSQKALDSGVRWLTFYALTAENWARPRVELANLLSISRWPETKSLTERLLKQNVRVRTMGRPTDDPIAAETINWLEGLARKTEGNSGLNVTIAFNYSGQHEILDAARRLVEAGALPSALDADLMRAAMYVPEMPPLDLVIRTGGERRLSNFMLWHCAYAELLFTDTLFPDFTAGHFESALEDYAFRDRRYGGLPDAVTTERSIEMA